MKKTMISILLAFLLLFSLVGCSQQKLSDTDMALADIAEAIMESQPELPEMKQMTPKEEDFPVWLSGYYFLQADRVEDGIICYADGVEASEIAVLMMADEGDCRTAEEALTAYVQSRVSVFEGYAPRQAAVAREGIVAVNGRYIALLICPESSAAKSAFFSCFEKKTEDGADTENEKSSSDETAVSALAQETDESAGTSGAEDFYHADAVLQAWRSGDESSLSETDRRILDAAKAVIVSEIDDGMSDYEKELAVHDFITDWSRFDYSVFGRSSSEGFEPGSDTPYGVLIDQSAMCHGYSSTFQLLMDMLDIECITVFGIPGSNGVEHSWNMVKLDGEWYCVDVAWDDPIGGSPGHTYFNVTSEYLRKGSIHRWDETSVPEASGTAYAYGSY